MTLRERVLGALATVHDPELDEPITALGFVASCVVSKGAARVVLRLPTPQCAPNFAFLMAADARAAVLSVPGVRTAEVALEDHFTQAEINAAVGLGGDFEAAFPGESEGDLEALRELFRRKALLARQARLCQALLAGGDATTATQARVADLPDGPDARAALRLRRVLGLPCDRGAPALIGGDGSPLAPDELPRWLRRARLVSLSLETNGAICRDLLAIRREVAA